MDHRNLIEVAKFTPFPFKQDSAWIGHVSFASWLIKTLKPKIFVELGTHWGHSYFSFCQAVNEEKLKTKCYAVDTWQGDAHSGEYGDEVFQQVSHHNEKNYANFSSLLRTKFDDGISYFKDSSIELLHIDGLHTYEAVRHDFETWLPKLAPDAVVLFHDTEVYERNFGVWKIWKELQLQYPNNLEFPHSYGLGVLQLNGYTKESKLDWLSPEFTDQQLLKDYFSALGARQKEKHELQIAREYIIKLTQVDGERDRQFESLNKKLLERDIEVDALNKKSIAYSAQITKLENSVKERVRQVEDLNKELERLDKEMKKQNQNIAERDIKLEEYELLVEENKRLLEANRLELNALINSRSWRFTLPLRKIANLVRNRRSDT